MIQDLRNAMSNLTPTLPLEQGEWCRRKFSLEASDFEVISMCPLTALAVSDGLIDMGEVHQNRFDLAERVCDALSRKYDTSVSQLNQFVLHWDNSTEISVQKACEILDLVMKEDGV